MKFSIRDSRLVSVGVASVVAVGVIGFGSAAFAQEGGATPTPSTQGDGTHPERCDGIGKGLALKHLLRNAGVTLQEIAEGKAAGLTWGQILDQYGNISAAEAKQQALDALEAQLDKAVANGRITQEQADERLAEASTRIDAFLGSVPGDRLPGGGHGRPGARGIGGQALETIAGVLGTDVETLKGELASGKTVAEIAGDKTQAVIDALVAGANAKIDEAVANGRITEEKASEMKARIREAVTKFVNEGGPLKGIDKALGRWHGRPGEMPGQRR